MIAPFQPQPSPATRRVVVTKLLLPLLIVAGLIAPRSIDAQITEDLKELESIQQPLAVINIAGIDRVIDDVGYVFRSVDRNDMMDVLQGALDRVGNLKGFDRTKPFGVMVFLQPGFPPQPEAIGYLPVNNLKDLSKTLENGPLVLKKSTAGENRYELTGPNRTFYVLMRDDYAFVSNSSAVLDRQLPDPARASQMLTDRFDVGLRLNLGSIPEGIRTLFMNFLRSSANAEMQRRDDEPEGAYLARRANSESTLILIEQVVTQCDDILIGFKASPEDHTLTFDINFEARPDSKFAKYLQDIAGKQSYFTSVLDEQSPFTLSVSWNMDEREKKSLKTLLDLGKEAAQTELSEPDAEDGAINSLFTSLQATADAGHIDLFAQMVPVGQAQFALVGGIRLSEAEQMSGALRQFLSRMSERPELKSVELDVASHQGITLHRIQGNESRPEDERMYGKNAGLFVGTGSNTLWFSVGSDKSLDALRDTIDLVTESLALGADRSGAPPFQIVSNIESWFVLQNDEGAPSRRQEMSREAFDRDNDQIRLEVRPTENGARFRIQMQEGFIRMIGLGVSNRYDRSQI